MSPSEPSAVQHPPAAAVRLQSFHELMQRRIHRILLVASLYDSFILSEEGQLQETLLGHFLELSLGHAPDLVQASNADQALALLGGDPRFDLVIASLGSGALELARRLRASGVDLPVLGLAYTGRELAEFQARGDAAPLERLFLWQGDVRIFVAMVKHVEDRLNVAHDTGACGIPVILVVEDSVRAYSSFLPSIYSELLRHTEHVLAEGLNPSQKMMRMRARPKVLLCGTYEEAWSYFERYEEHVLGIVSDVEFPHAGKLDAGAGVELCARALRRRPGLRLVLQSSAAENRASADELGASFLLKGSPTLLGDLRRVLVDRFGFGDFVFRLPDRREVDRASTLRDFAEKLRTIPDESLAYHAERDHFSSWLKARTELALAEEVRPWKTGDFTDVPALRARLLESIERFRLERHLSVITDFDRQSFEPLISITRIGGGSLGGKARGVAFANRLLRGSGIAHDYPGVRLHVPPCAVLCTEVFDEFLEYPGLRDLSAEAASDAEVAERFLEAPFPRGAISDLQAFLQRVRYPLAVRSSSLLEDSLSQPFAGVYSTYMLPNNELELEERWQQLARAIKLVYASAFLEQARTYLGLTAYRLEEEKMAVMVQALVGHAYEERFYPHFSGVARSYNFYPEPGQAAEDGIAAVALGLGHTVVGGDPCLRFSPRHPRRLLGWSAPADALESSQREFHALDLGRLPHDGARVRRFTLDVAEQDGTLAWLGSTWCPEDHRVVDGIARPGVRLVSFAQILKHGAFPLPELLDDLLGRCRAGTGAPVEIEFAGNLGSGGRRAELAFLQLRPMALAGEAEQVEIGAVDQGRVLCRSAKVLGNGRIDDVRDLVVVDPLAFRSRRTREVAAEVARCDALLRREGRPYVLIGAGRWGSSDASLGTPVVWSQISGARVIVEAGIEGLRVEPSQGTHFFQNLTACGVGYLTVNPDLGDGTLDWEWLAAQDALESRAHVRRLRFAEPVRIVISGRAGAGVILKPPNGQRAAASQPASGAPPGGGSRVS